MEDRETFMQAEDYPVTLVDGIVVRVDQDDDDGYMVDGTFYECAMVGIVVTDGRTGAEASLFSIAVPSHYSGMDCRAQLWGDYLDCGTDLLREVRSARDRELAERAYWAACDVVTVA